MTSIGISVVHLRQNRNASTPRSYEHLPLAVSPRTMIVVIIIAVRDNPCQSHDVTAPFRGSHGPVELDYPLGASLVLPLSSGRLRSEANVGGLGEDGVVPTIRINIVVVVCGDDGKGVIIEPSPS